MRRTWGWPNFVNIHKVEKVYKYPRLGKKRSGLKMSLKFYYRGYYEPKYKYLSCSNQEIRFLEFLCNYMNYTNIFDIFINLKINKGICCILK